MDLLSNLRIGEGQVLRHVQGIGLSLTVSSKLEKPAFNITPGIRNFMLWIGLGCLVRGTPTYLFGCNRAARSYYCGEIQTL
jgi:hypothetical protein